MTDCEVCDAVKQVGLIKSQGINGLPYEMYLRQLNTFVPLLMDLFNHWFSQGAILGHVSKGVITLPKKVNRYGREGLHDYRTITLLNTKLMILAQVLANCLQIIASDLIETEQTLAE